MQSLNALPEAPNTQGVSQSEITDEVGGEKGPSITEIRERASEIHIERGGIHGRDLWDRFLDWLQAERELQEKYKSKGTGEQRSEMRH